MTSALSLSAHHIDFSFEILMLVLPALEYNIFSILERSAPCQERSLRSLFVSITSIRLY